MKTALIITTINIPHVLHLYRKYGPEVRFFVAVDRKTPSEAIEFLSTIPDCEIVDGGSYWKCSELIGWNSIQRRNLALLEALKWGAEIIVSVDDDNLPINEDYFRRFNEVLIRRPFSGLCAGGNEWFDIGTLLQPIASHRGFPANRAGWAEFTSIIDAKIGVAAGICLGDPDTSAYWRMAHHPTVHQVSQLLESGIVVHPYTWTVFNSQNTAIVRELAPAWHLWCGVGRYDDILASLVVQRVMRQRNLHVHFGKPFVYQQRNQHNLQRDLEGEVWGMWRLPEIADFLDRLTLPDFSAIDQSRFIFTQLQSLPWFPPITGAAALAFLDDCEKVMK